MIPARSASATQSAPPRPSRAIANGRWARSARRAPAPSNTPSTRNAGAATSRVRDMGAVKAKKATEGRKGGRGICFTHARAKRFDPGAPARSARLRGRAQARGARVPRRAGAALRARAPRAAGAPPRAPARDRRRPVAGLPARDAPYQRPRLDGRADPPRPARPPRRDYRPGRAQDDDQRAQLGRQRVHGGLRGRERPHVGEQRARPAEPARRGGRHDRVHERRGKALRPGAAHRDAGGAGAGMARRRTASARGRRAECVVPDRGAVTMDQPFLRAYAEHVIRTCHRRGIHALGGMAAQIPIKRDPALNAQALDKVRQDKLREVRQGHDGTWVAHPALVPLAREVFDAHMKGPHQIAVKRDDVRVTARDLLAAPSGAITADGLRKNLDVALRYLAAWLGGAGCVPIYDLMEDAATAEISRD